ncbi:MAG: hypothetical protein ACI808_002911 [Paraglaciecola sp.]|jgi:hypothetical protein
MCSLHLFIAMQTQTPRFSRMEILGHFEVAGVDTIGLISHFFQPNTLGHNILGGIDMIQPGKAD